MDTQPCHAKVGEVPTSWKQREHYEVQPDVDLASRLHQPSPWCILRRSKQDVELLTSDSELSESDDSPSRGFGECEKALMVQSHGDMHRCLVKLLEFEETGTTVNFRNVFAKVFKVPNTVPHREVRGLRP